MTVIIGQAVCDSICESEKGVRVININNLMLAVVVFPSGCW